MAGCSLRHEAMLRRAKPLLGTLVEVACTSDAGATADAALVASEAAFAAVARVHRLMSRHEPGSDLSLFNAAAVGEWLSVEDDTARVFAFALQLSGQTQGVFDVCGGAGHGSGSWCDIELDCWHRRVRKRAALQADFGGIAKGYAVDLAVQALQSAGMGGGWVNAGGDVRAFGGIELPVMVRSPRDLSRVIGCTKLRNRAAATSARYLAADPDAHLFNGATGQVINSDDSWTVAAPHCMTADALTKLIAATGDAQHPLLAHYDAQAWIY